MLKVIDLFSSFVIVPPLIESNELLFSLWVLLLCRVNAALVLKSLLQIEQLNFIIFEFSLSFVDCSFWFSAEVILYLILNSSNLLLNSSPVKFEFCNSNTVNWQIFDSQ